MSGTGLPGLSAEQMDNLRQRIYDTACEWIDAGSKRNPEGLFYALALLDCIRLNPDDPWPEWSAQVRTDAR